MEAVTLLIAAVASFLVFFLTPIYGLIVYIAAFACYPTYITAPVGTIDFTVSRIVILVILAKLFLLTDLPKRFRFILLDKCIIIFFAAQFLAGVMNSSPLRQLFENRCGTVFDMVLPYLAARMVIQNKQQYLTLLKWILIITAPLAIVGFYESLTGTNLLGFFEKYNAWGTLSGIPLAERSDTRYGFFRANTLFSHPIMHGLFFAMFGSMCVGLLRSVKRYKNLCIIGLILMGIGVFSSMSSGSWVVVFLAVPFIVSYRWRNYLKPVVVSFIVMCGLVEIISNRHFYDVLSDFTFSAANAWYRSKLIDVALFEGGMSGHWLFGYPFGTDPGWGPKISGLSYTDMVNHYLGILCRFGLVSLVPFIAMNIAAIKNLADAYKESILDSEKWLVWCLASGLFGVLVTMNSTTIYGPPICVFYIMLACCGVMPSIVGKECSLSSMRNDANSSYNRKSFICDPSMPY